MSAQAEFWHFFQQSSAALEQSDGPALETLYDHLRKIHKRLYLHTARENSGEWNIILSAEGRPELLPILDDLVAQAPIVPRWAYVPCYDGDFILGRRNEELYPDDVIGDTLYRMVLNGDRPWISRDVDFSVIFPDEESADEFLAYFEPEDARLVKDSYTHETGFTFQVTVTRPMRPTHKNITRYEQKIAKAAAEFDGRNDGWGCFRMNE